MNKIYASKEIVASFLIIILLTVFLDPFHVFMSSKFVMMYMLLLIVVFAIFTTFIWKENARDEREGLHRLLAGRNAFLVGSTVLVIGIIVQSFNHAVDPWLVITLGAMIIAKMIGFIAADMKH